MKFVEYNSNNSGGSWWLGDEDWRALENAGWRVVWNWLVNVYEDGQHVFDEGMPALRPWQEDDHRVGQGPPNSRWLGALARTAYLVADSIEDAARSWSEATSKSPLEAGCACCGQPHRFTLYNGNDWVDSGPNVNQEVSW